MDRVLSTHLMVQERLSVAWLQKAASAGISGVEIFCARQHFDYRDKAQVRELALWFRDSELKLHSLHSPMFSDLYWGRSGPDSVLNITERGKAERIRVTDEIKRAIEVAEQVPVKYLIQHIGAVREEYTEHKVEAAFTALEELRIFSRQRGIDLLLENIPNELSTAERLNYFLRTTHLDLGYAFDTGHANMSNGVEHEWELMKTRVKSLHVHDNNGTDDSHLFPTLSTGGTIDWPRAMELLRAGNGGYPLLLELKNNPEFPDALEASQRVFERLERL